MRYGPIADDPLEELMLGSSPSLLPLFDSFVPLVQASALMVGVRSGVFENLANGPSTVDDLAVTLHVDRDTLLLPLRVLSASSYLAGDDTGTFELSDVARTTLLESSRDRFTAWVTMLVQWWANFAQLHEVPRTGQGGDLHDELTEASEWATYQAAMLENARRLARFVATMVPVKPGATRLLDIGGSHGLFGALIARANPPMRSEVLDLPLAVEQAQPLAEAEGLADVVTYRVGNALVDEFDPGYDVVFVGNLLHHFTPDRIAQLLARIGVALSPDGTVAIWEVLQPDAGEKPDLIGDAFALFFQLTSGARCYTATEYETWLRDAGFVDIGVQRLPLGRSLALITGRAP